MNSEKVTSVVNAIFEAHQKTPEKMAIIDRTYTYTYSEFIKSVLGIARYLGECELEEGRPIAICADNSARYVILTYAIMYAGHPFVPLPPRDPDLRISELCLEADVPLIFSDRPRVLGEGIQQVGVEFIFNENRPPGSEWLYQPQDTSKKLAYVMFTSGSTGAPKGVCISLDSFYHAADQAASIMAFSNETVSHLILPLHFDGSFSSVFAILLRGGMVYVNNGSICLPATFFSIMKDYRVNHTSITPTFLKILLDSSPFKLADCTSWDTLAVGGEHPRKRDLQKLLEKQPSLHIYNRYGPTEATMAVSTRRIYLSELNGIEPIPIGIPHKGVKFFAFNDDGQSISAGEQAELYIGGRQLMQGYLGGNETGVFVRHPQSDEKLLISGDLVTIDSKGEYIVLERVDNVVKRHGTRVALGEIENVFLSLDSVDEVVCVSEKNDLGVKITAFVKTKFQQDEKVLRRMFLSRAPSYMNPDVIIFVDELPVAPGGKYDRKLLKEEAIS